MDPLALDLEIYFRIVAALFLGACVGAERQWRSRSAGLRTNALVSLGSALFVIMGAYAFTGVEADPTRVAAQVASGIGFLGAGVILKEGASIIGLNTAATLWASAAVGCLAGGGMYTEATLGAACIVGANILLRRTAKRIDAASANSKEDGQMVKYTFRIGFPIIAEEQVRQLVFQALNRPRYTVKSIDTEDLENGLDARLTLVVTSPEGDYAKIEKMIEQVVRAPDVTSLKWDAEPIEARD